MNTMTKPTLVLLAVLAVAVGAAGCGGNGASSDETAIRNQLEAFRRAANARDFETICNEIISPGAKNTLETLGGPCPQKFEEDTPTSLRIEGFTVENVTVNGDEALVDYSYQSGGQTRRETRVFVKVDGEWRLDLNP